MNAPLLPTPLAVREVDLRDTHEVARWDAFVSAHPDATPFHTPAWCLAVAEGCRQLTHLLVAERADGRIAGLLPLTEVHSPLFGRALVSTGFAVDGGILADQPKATSALAHEMGLLAERLSCPTLELRGGADPGEGWHEDTHSYLGFARDLAADEEAELKAIPRKQRAEVRRSLDYGLTAEVGADRAVHHAIYAESVRNLGTPVFPASLFAAVLDHFGEQADILTIRKDGQPVASVLSLYWRGTVYPYWGGGTHAARGLRANDLMYYALMNHARARGCTRFDFGRSKAGTGAAAFKKNWGFDGRPLAYWKRAIDGRTLREINPLNPKYRLQVAAWQRLPLGLATRLGPMISRGLG